MRKIILTLLLATAVVLAATACRSGSDSTAKDKGQSNSSKEEKDENDSDGGALSDLIGIFDEMTGKKPSSPDNPVTAAPIATPTEAPTEAPTVAPAQWNPDFTFKTEDFDMFGWDETCFANAKLTMINLWAYWCGPCVGELPEIERLSNDYADRGLQVFGISYPEEEAENRELVDELGITYQNLFYTSDFDEYMETGYLPTTIFVDSTGHVLGEAIIGSRSYEDWAEIVDNYLAGQ